MCGDSGVEKQISREESQVNSTAESNTEEEFFTVQSVRSLSASLGTSAPTVESAAPAKIMLVFVQPATNETKVTLNLAAGGDGGKPTKTNTRFVYKFKCVDLYANDSESSARIEYSLVNGTANLVTLAGSQGNDQDQTETVFTVLLAPIPLSFFDVDVASGRAILNAAKLTPSTFSSVLSLLDESNLTSPTQISTTTNPLLVAQLVVEATKSRVSSSDNTTDTLSTIVDLSHIAQLRNMCQIRANTLKLTGQVQRSTLPKTRISLTPSLVVNNPLPVELHIRPGDIGFENRSAHFFYFSPESLRPVQETGFFARPQLVELGLNTSLESTNKTLDWTSIWLSCEFYTQTNDYLNEVLVALSVMWGIELTVGRDNRHAPKLSDIMPADGRITLDEGVYVRRPIASFKVR